MLSFEACVRILGVTLGYQRLYQPKLCLCENLSVGDAAAVVAGHSATGSIVKGNRPASEVCWLLQDDLSSLEWLFHLNT